MEPYEGEPPDVAVGEIRVARGFNLDRTTWDLVSTAQSYRWTAGDQEAACLRAPMPATGTLKCPCGCGSIVPIDSDVFRRMDHGIVPDPACSCGFYGAYSFKTNPINVSTIVGIAEMWGRMRMGTRGVRAQHARLIAVARGESWMTQLTEVRAVGEKYGVPAFETIDAMCEAYPLVDPSEYGIHAEPVGDYEFMPYLYYTITASVSSFQSAIRTISVKTNSNAYSSSNVWSDAGPEPADADAQPDRPIPKPRVDPKFTTFTGPGRRAPKRLGGLL